MTVKIDDLTRAIGAHARPAIEARVPIWADACWASGITDLHTFAHYLAQVAHESDRFKTATEYWGPTPTQLRYEGRKDLGNIRIGDGSRFRGRGDIQYTGRDNYTLARADIDKLGLDYEPPYFDAMPQLLAGMPWACLSSIGYWNRRKISEAIARDPDPVMAATRRINGGTNGITDRRALYLNIALALAGCVSVQAFQAMAGLTADGVAGPKTHAALRWRLASEKLRFDLPPPLKAVGASAIPAAIPGPKAAKVSYLDRLARLLNRR